MEVDKYKESKINLETKKKGSNPYSTTTLVKLSLVAYIKSDRGTPRGTTKHITQYTIDFRLDNRIDTKLRLRRHAVNTIMIIY
jgi:hypothetical protein